MPLLHCLHCCFCVYLSKFNYTRISTFGNSTRSHSLLNKKEHGTNDNHSHSHSHIWHCHPCLLNNSFILDAITIVLILMGWQCWCGVNVNEIIKIIEEYLNLLCLSFRFFVRLRLQLKRIGRTNYIKM